MSGEFEPFEDLDQDGNNSAGNVILACWRFFFRFLPVLPHCALLLSSLRLTSLSLTRNGLTFICNKH